MESTCEEQGKESSLERDKQTSMMAMECLPNEIVFNILSSLPISSLMQIKFVSRSLFNLTLDPLLINMHSLRRIEKDPCLILHSDYPIRNQVYFIDLSADNENDKRVKKFDVPLMPEFDVIDSCNGLLCLKGPSPLNELYIYNPFTRDHLELPGSTLDHDKDQVFAFGFHPCSKEYKVVKIVQHKNARSALSPRENSTIKKSEAYIFTVGSSSTWRSIGKFPYTVIRWIESHVFVNGRIHWIFYPLYYESSNLFQLMSIDIADEKLREVPIPACEEFKGMCHLVVLGGCLSAVFYRVQAIIEIWVMKKYDVRGSWNREFRIVGYVPRRLKLETDVDPSFRTSKLYGSRGRRKVLCLLKSGEILLEYKRRVLVSYDPTSGTFKDLSFPGMLSWFQTLVHLGNLNWIDTLIDM